MNYYQIFLPSGTLLFLLLVFVLRSVIVWKQIGINPFVFGKTDNAHDYIGWVYKVMTMITWVSIVLFSFLPEYYSYVNPITYLERSFVQLAGVGIFIVAFIWTAIAQYQMSKSWRIGIDYEEKTELVNSGVFSISRNPVFLGVLLSYFGTFLIAPNTLSFSVLLVIFFIIQTQIRLEEEYLENVHKQAYINYRSIVRRWL